MRFVMLVIPLLVASPLIAADPIHDLEHEAEYLAGRGQAVLDHVESHKDCSSEDLGFFQTDGYHADGTPYACDAADSFATLEADRYVLANNHTRGFLVFAQEGIDDDDFFRMSTRPDDSTFRYVLRFDLGLDSAPDVDFGSIDFDVLTQAGDSLLDADSAAYQRPAGFREPAFPAPAPGSSYQDIAVSGGYLESFTEFKVVVTPEGSTAPSHAWIQLEDDSWVQLTLQSDVSTAKKYTASVGDAVCGVKRIYIELPDSGVKKAPHVAHAPPQGLCDAIPETGPAPIKEPMAGEFTVPAWLAGEELVVRIWVSEHTPAAGERQANGVVDEVLGLFQPRTMSCDDEGMCGLISGPGGGLSMPVEYDLDMLRSRLA